MVLRRAVRLGAALAASLILLTGCVPVDDVKARYSGTGAIDFAFCDPYAFDQITVTADEGEGASIAWRVSGDGRVSAGQAVEYGVIPDGFVEVEPAQAIDAHSGWLTISLENLDTNGEVLRSQFGKFEVTKLSASEWLGQDGALVSGPCV